VERLRSETVRDGTVQMILSSQETELLSGLPALTVNRAQVRTWPSASFRIMATDYEQLAGKLKRVTPPKYLTKFHVERIDRVLAQAKILSDAALRSDANGSVPIATPEFIRLCKRWQDLASDDARSRAGQVDLPPLRVHGLSSFLYVVCASDPELMTSGAIPAWRFLTSPNPIRNITVVILTAILVFIGLRLAFSSRAAFWAPAFCTWSAWISCLPGLLTFASYTVWLCGSFHCESLEDVEIISCEHLATLWLGFLNAGMLQVLGVILFLAGRRK
jgi:hypothetical protein